MIKGKIAYSGFTDGYWQIWVMDCAAKSAVQLTSSKVDKKTPVWSPEGKRIIYRTSNGEFFLIDVESKEEKRIFSKLGYLVDPSWISLERILFARYRSDLKDDSDIWSADLNGAGVKVINEDLGLQYFPAISPDGEKIVYVSGKKAHEHDIWVMNKNGQDKVLLVQKYGYDICPRWSPDGKSIVFVSDRTGSYEIWIMNADGSNQTQFTRTKGYNNNPAWSPDGERIVFVSNAGGDLQLWVMDKDGNNAVQITRGAECVDPAWCL
ncbi:MAG: hypothetical protein ABII88_07605 [Candidatus Omnitrophota bacterium]